ncbi:transmembrane amino acid transporter protein-domain-containing protein [Xylariaceae sp. FL0594]|nr:transmembrane amino acid transporter protein-domain-containing protein [Xylariaceae sp. FL0594]
MPNYSAITYAGSNASSVGSSASGDMARNRRVKPHHPKDGGGGTASMFSSVTNLLNTILGAGTLAMPSALSHFGMVLGVIVILWSGFTSAFGLYLQSRSARYLDRGSSSFFALSQLTYPNAAVIFDAAIAIKCFGVGVSYMIIIGDLMPGVIEGFDSRAASVGYLMDRNFWITVFMLAIIPLSFLRRLDSLKYTSIIALIAIGYLIVLVVYHFASDVLAPREKLRIIQWAGPVEALASLPVVIFAYTCHQNMFSILNELQDNSPKSVIGVLFASIGSAAGVYVLVSITGYLTFGNDITGNIVSMYTPSIASTLAKAAIVVLVTFSVPLQIHPCRASVDAVLKWRPNAISSPGRTSSPNSRLLLPTATRSDHGPSAPMSELRFAVLTTILLILAYTVALTVTSLERVLAYVGSTGSTAISFILPGLFYYKISDPESIHHQRLAKEDDDALSTAATDDEYEDDAENNDDAEAAASVTSIRSGIIGTRGSKWRTTKWRWDMEHINPVHLRRAALALAIYGVCVMLVCLAMNMVGTYAH